MFKQKQHKTRLVDVTFCDVSRSPSLRPLVTKSPLPGNYREFPLYNQQQSIYIAKAINHVFIHGIINTKNSQIFASVMGNILNKKSIFQNQLHSSVLNHQNAVSINSYFNK